MFANRPLRFQQLLLLGALAALPLAQSASAAGAGPAKRTQLKPASPQSLPAASAPVAAAAQPLAVDACDNDAAEDEGFDPGRWDMLESDRTLKGTLGRWARDAGWRLVWEAPVDYAVESNSRILGTMEQAVELVVQGMESAETPIKAILYQRNNVIRIVAKGAP